jgi:hypothetical protein
VSYSPRARPVNRSWTDIVALYPWGHHLTDAELAWQLVGWTVALGNSSYPRTRSWACCGV